MAAKYLTMVGQLQWLVTWGDLTSMLKYQPYQDSEFPLDNNIWTDSKESMPMPLGLRTMQLGVELNHLTIPSYQIKILTGHTLYVVMSIKSFLMTCQNHLERL